ncbi:MAG: hypothetical protein M0T72_12085 [Candidatus Dormibacteraeota bacterium]|nr:hypothetical protein [Candidatus Dormibacteraeota bacterium]
MTTVKVSMNLTTDEDAFVTQLAERHRRTKTDVVRRALALQKLYEELAPNGKLEVRTSDGSERIYMPW